jgi:ATP-binding cassette subfamily B protein
MAEKYRQKRLESVNVGLLYFPTMGLSTLFSYGVLLCVGSYKVMQGELGIGEFLAMQNYVILIQDPLVELGHIVSEWQRARTGLKRLAEVYQHPADQHVSSVQESSLQAPLPSITTKTISSVFKIERLSFRYDHHVLFHDVQLQVRPGERIGIMGPVGIGKTTFLHCLSGLEQNYHGHILLHHQSIKKYSHLQLRSLIGLVPQKPFLFAQSIFQNINLDLNLTEDEVWHYLKLAGLEHDLMRFPERLNTPLGEWGINLSGGQKQRLTLARTLIRKHPILLLDDCLSAVDTVTEQKILKNLQQHLKETTMVWVAHRRSTLADCHRILDFGQMFQKEKIGTEME